MTTPPVGHSTKAGLVYQDIRNQILNGDLGPDSPLDEVALAEAHGVSRTPVREALRALHSEGLLQRGSRRQLLVVDVTEQHRSEITLLRVALEGTAVARACEVHTSEDLDTLELLIIKQERSASSGDSETFLRLDEEFHLALASTARLTTLSQMLTTLGAFVRLVRIGETTSVTHMLGVLREHRQLVALLRARQPDELRNALELHIRNVGPRTSLA